MKYILTENQVNYLRRRLEDFDTTISMTKQLHNAMNFYDVSRFQDYEKWKDKVIHKAASLFLFWNSNEDEYAKLVSSDDYTKLLNTFANIINDRFIDIIEKRWKNKKD